MTGLAIRARLGPVDFVSNVVGVRSIAGHFKEGVTLLAWYVYVLRSLVRDFMYVGRTRDLDRRFGEHQNGLSLSTKVYRPFSLELCVMVKTEKQARELERYFKSGSGRAVLKKHFLS